MKITRCDRCGREYEPKELEPVTIRDINVNRIRIGTTAGMSDGTDLCQECLNEFKIWWEKPKEVPEFTKKYTHFGITEESDVIELEDILTAVEGRFTLNPPSGKLLKIAGEMYNIKVDGMTTKQILLGIADKEIKGWK